MSLKIAVEIVDLACATGQPLARVPSGVKFPGREDRFGALRHRQLRIKNCATHFQMRIERLARDEEPHDFTRAFKDRVNATVSQKALDRNWRLAAAGQ